ncbi:MAG: heme exporter protein CcmB [Chloroflexi bacterium]|nr:heme exporter protein CcmB [Chloroflexota bacterium]
MAQASVAAPVQASRDTVVPSLVRQVWVLLAKEVRVELRSKETVPSMAVFALAALIIFQFAFDLRGPTLSLVAPGVLWVAVLFASILGLGRSFAREVERGSLEGLLVAPLDPGALYVAKVLGNLALLLVLAAVIVPLGAILFGLDLFRPGLLLFLPLGSLGIAAVGTILAAVAANTRAREALLPIILLPLLVPVVIAGVKGTGLALDGRPWVELQVWAGLLVAYDVLFTTISYLTFNIVMEQ